MKKLLVLLNTLLYSTLAFCQWSPTNYSSATNNFITDFCEHNGNLYSSSYEQIKKWDPNAEIWINVSFAGFQVFNLEYIANIVSAGNYLYVTKFDPYCASGMVYKSSDDGLTFVADTMGLQKSAPCDSLPTTILALFSLPNGNMVAETGCCFYTKHPIDAMWVTSNSLVRYMAFSGSNWYKIGFDKLYKSTDQGTTWTTNAVTSFPPGIQPRTLSINEVTQRIYLNFNYGFDNVSLYTDNEGATWDTLAVNDYLGTSVFGTDQTLLSFYAAGNHILFGAEQNVNGSSLEVYESFDGGITFMADTNGLPINSGIEEPRKFHVFNNEIFMVTSGTEIFRKDEVLKIDELKSFAHVILYPNPSTNNVFIKSNFEVTSVEVIDLNGNQLKSIFWDKLEKSIDISTLQNGIYILKVYSDTQYILKRIVKQ